ncbi:uncharacterized protein isoform X2 [Choristoneura fumiferana]|uniref:uncharacterized protein isoform X2 n=1 Tax=Choristoneura fumiferana TaxID=7141 RepID=UPI003D15D583
MFIRKLEKLVQYASESNSDSDDDETRAPTDPEDLREVVMIVEEESPENIQEGGEAGSGEKNEDVLLENETLSESVINILGDDGLNQEEAHSCLPELATRWENILKTGLKKEIKDTIQSKYKGY